MRSTFTFSFLQNSFQKKLLKRILSLLLAFAVFSASTVLTSAMAYQNHVILNYNGTIKEFYTDEKDTDNILHDCGISLSDKDECTVNTDKREINIQIRTKVFVTIQADGNTVSSFSRPSANVLDAILDAGIKINTEDLTDPPLTAPITNGMNIQIGRIVKQTHTTNEEIPFDTITENTDKLLLGNTQIAVNGENGLQTQTYEDTYLNGVLVQTVPTTSEVVRQPVNQVILSGTTRQQKAVTGAKSELTVPAQLQFDAKGIPTSYTKVITGRACAYTSDPSAKTSTGKTVKPGYVAVNPKYIPYGTKMYIVSTDGYVYGYAIAADTGSSCMANDITVDLFMNSTAECVAFGSRTVNIYLV